MNHPEVGTIQEEFNHIDVDAVLHALIAKLQTRLHAAANVDVYELAVHNGAVRPGMRQLSVLD
jgi:hypothetical protein